MLISGLITGTLGYSLKREFLANALALREVESFNYDIYSVDVIGFSAGTIQQQIKDQFAKFYSGDINVTLFSTQHAYAFPSDSLRAAKFNVNVEIRSQVKNVATIHPELGSGYYAGLDAQFFSGYGPYLTDFKESFNFSTNSNGNREFLHDVSFGLKTGWGVDGATQSGRKAYAQNLVSGIFSRDKDTTFGIATMVGQISTLADSGVFKNYYNETYDLFKNTYSFSRRRELLPFDYTNSIYNLSNSLSLNVDGTTDVSEKASLQGKIDFNSAKNSLEDFLTGAYNRCSGLYTKFYNANVIMQDGQYGVVNFGTLLPLINTPIKTVKNYDARSLNAGYEVSFSNNPIITGNASVAQTIEFTIDEVDKVEGVHTFDYTVNRVQNPASYFVTLMNQTTGVTIPTMSGYYNSDLHDVTQFYPNINITKVVVSCPNIKTKASVKFTYSNNPSYFITTDNTFFRILDYTVEQKKPVDIVNEYKVVNRPTKTSVLSYGYQTEKGEVSVNFKASLGKQSRTFFPLGTGDFSTWNTFPLSKYLQAIYKLAGKILMDKFAYPTTAFNWFISDSKYVADGDGNLNVQITYTYTLKKRSAGGYP